ncbi:hypothetical protein [Paenibacillus nasutitermitis]|uniref:Prolipoprotein diacylglyceryl transferase n=1 Tax=Paenibacillus nasutitermitis TaxID=1652958 RepID=A0A916YIX7_9BACL|nr:hypothetical protein [Paenibacillus nasutitermitis]GGD47118.1 hypothetical protein GCM10010911_00840 [Paenibacillus nasutitermitis]
MMPELVSIGGARLDGVLLTYILSAAAGFGALWIWLKKRPDVQDRFSLDLLINAALIALLVWKLAFIVRDPQAVWHSPASLILVRGSSTDALFGLFAAIIYLLIALRLRKLPWRRLMDVAPFAVLPGCVLWNGLSDFPYRLIYAILLLVVYGYMLRVAAVSGSGESARTAMLGAGIGGLAVSLFAPYPPGTFPELTGGLSALQWCFVLMGAAGALLRSHTGIGSLSGEHTSINKGGAGDERSGQETGAGEH